MMTDFVFAIWLLAFVSSNPVVYLKSSDSLFVFNSTLQGSVELIKPKDHDTPDHCKQLCAVKKSACEIFVHAEHKPKKPTVKPTSREAPTSEGHFLMIRTHDSSSILPRPR
ncbi:MAG: hypothetical protein WBD45_23970, partial [Terriglobales bacterium]